MANVLALAGQVGGAKLAEGLYRFLGKNLTVIVNTMRATKALEA